MSIAIGVLFMVGTYLMLTRSILRVVIGIVLLSHGAHLLLLTMAGLKEGMPALVDQAEWAYTDPLPQALILTAIVISFGMTSFSLALAYRLYNVHKTDDLDELRGANDD